jgi:hypothetical protein
MSIQTDSGVLVFTPHSRGGADDDSSAIPYPPGFKGIGILPTLTTEGSLETRTQVYSNLFVNSLRYVDSNIRQTFHES